MKSIYYKLRANLWWWLRGGDITIKIEPPNEIHVLIHKGAFKIAVKSPRSDYSNMPKFGVGDTLTILSGGKTNP